MFRKDGSGVYRCSSFERFAWLEHGFGTRYSPGWPAGGRIATLKQIHSAKSFVASEIHGCVGEGDALITAQPGQMIAVRTADCLPILMAAPRERVVAAVHAGWRGTAQNIAGRTAERLGSGLGVVLDELEVAMGPGIGPCCYEVGPEVLEEFRDLMPETPRGGKGTLDLAEANRRQLVAAGVPASGIHLGAPCTSCAIEEFFSYRRRPEERGRMVSAIGIRVGE